jgi:hypothetical protein
MARPLLLKAAKMLKLSAGAKHDKTKWVFAVAHLCFLRRNTFAMLLGFFDFCNVLALSTVPDAPEE